jgi:hypothetical protein
MRDAWSMVLHGISQIKRTSEKKMHDECFMVLHGLSQIKRAPEKVSSFALQQIQL